jgi:RNA 2',3'-cyclic 3'-phosphodiesterase
MRLFFALWPDATLQRELALWARACRGVSAGRLIREDNLHATLAFVGEVDSSGRALLDELGAALQAEPFALELDRIGYWPHNRIVFAAASTVPPPLLALAQRLTRDLAANGFRVDARPYVPHVTLLRDARRAPSFAPPAALRWSVREISLVESLRVDERLVYRPVQRWTLAN